MAVNSLLAYQEYGDAQKPSLILLHGLFGNKKNWSSVARHLQDDWRVIAVDLRNHGESFHDPNMLYPTLAQDIQNLCASLKIEKTAMVGHSLGGKVLLQLVRQAETLISKAVVVDIGPVAYVGGSGPIFTYLQNMPLNLNNFLEADQHLAQHLKDKGLRQFLLTNLRQKEGQFSWRIPLESLEKSYHGLNQFSAMPTANPTAVDFIFGTQSDYLNLTRQQQTLLLFPRSRFFAVEKAAHWVHVDNPKAFLQVLKKLL